METEIDREALVKAVQNQLPKTRWEHTLRVMETADTLARRFGVDPVKADLASLLHDYCKFWSEEKLRKWIQEYKLPSDLLNYDKELWHAPVGAEAVQEEWGIGDEEVLNAIRYHTTGRPGMSLLEQVVFIADYIEPGRSFPGVDHVRQLAQEDLNRAMLQALDNTISFLLSRGKKVYPLTFMARNYYVDQIAESE